MRADPPPIAFNRSSLLGGELEYVRQAAASGATAGDGPFTRRCQALLERELGAPRVLLTTSCTHALEMAMLLLDLGPGDEVIVPSFTFVSAANAVVLRGARPVFVDSRPDTLNLDEERLAPLVTERTRAIVAMHYAGVACAMERIARVADEHGLAIVEDNAHGLFARYHGKPLGSFGRFATQSFHDTKNFSCGEGGALVVNDSTAIERAEILREKGTDRSRFLLGRVDKYTWVDVGSSFAPSDLLAAYLLGQLEARETVERARRRIWERYRDELAEWASEQRVRLPVVPAGCEQSHHLFYLLLPSPTRRAAFIDHLRAAGVLACFHYQPLHRSRIGRQAGGAPAECPVADDAADRLVRLPLFAALGEAEQDRVVAAVRSFRVRR